MKTKPILVLSCLSFLVTSSLLGQNVALAEPAQEMEDSRWEAGDQVGSEAHPSQSDSASPQPFNSSTFQQSRSDSAPPQPFNSSTFQQSRSDSPMMMFRGGEKAKKAGGRSGTERDDG